jgi:5-methylcytosine-specific restriction enzyme A
MPKTESRPKTVSSARWNELWRIVHERDGQRCRHCKQALTLGEAHIDHVVRRPARPDNSLKNLVCFCRRCYVLRMTPSGLAHPGAIWKALADGVIPPDWRPLVW